MTWKLVDRTGQTHGTLTVAGRGNPPSRTNNGVALWIAQCSACGSTKTYEGGKLPRMKSCGCLPPQAGRRRYTRTPEHESWKSMWQRCRNPKASGYENYGGRGITCCDRWRIFANFYADMGTRPPDCDLDRIDNEGNYEPGNCRWATPEQQARNRRTNKHITINGETKCQSELAAKHNIDRTTLAQRLRLGWTTEDALTRPALPRKKSTVHS